MITALFEVRINSHPGGDGDWITVADLNARLIDVVDTLHSQGLTAADASVQCYDGGLRVSWTYPPPVRAQAPAAAPTPTS